SVSALGRSLAPPQPLKTPSPPGGPTMTLRVRSLAVAVALLAFMLAGSSALAQTRTLYDRLGGYGAISAVVDDFVKNVAADKRINRFFANANIDRLASRRANLPGNRRPLRLYRPRHEVGACRHGHQGQGFRRAGAGPRKEPQQVQSAGAGTEAIGRDSRAHEEGHRHALTLMNSCARLTSISGWATGECRCPP